MKTKLLSLMALTLSAFAGFAQFTTVHLTGNGVGGWNNPPLAINQMTTTNGVNYTLQNVQITGSGSGAAFKFMRGSNWDTTFGFATAPGWPTGVANSAGNDIIGVAGFWNVTYNLTTGEYAFTPGQNPNPTVAIPTATGSQNMLTTDGVTYGLQSVPLTAGSFRFSQTGTTNSWGSAAFPTGTATNGGTSVPVPNGTWNITFNRNTGAYSFSPTVVGMIGDGSPSGNWNTDAPMNTTNAIVYTLNNVTLVGNGMKIRDNGNWVFQFGTNGPNNTNAWPSGTFIQNGNDVLTVSGTYNISFNRSTGAYNYASVLSNDAFAKGAFNVYPNPTINAWKFMSSADEIVGIEIFDILGKVVLSKNTSNVEVSVDASVLTNGVYLAKISSAKGFETIRIVKN